MTTIQPETRAAAISARARTPSIDLAGLADLTAKAVPANPESFGPASFPLVRFDADHDRLRLNLRGILGRLLQNDTFQSAFTPGTQSGFVRDMDMPPRGTTAKMGGRLLSGSEAKASKAIEKLRDTISAEIDAALSGVDLRRLIAPSAKDVLNALGKRLDAPMPPETATASLIPIEFAPQDRKVEEREKDVARVLTAIEAIEGREWLEKMLAGVKRKLEQDDIPDEEVTSILETIRAQRDMPGSQIRRFIDFLDDEALARVRLQITFDLMEAVADQSPDGGLKEYVRRVRQCFDAFGGAAGESLPLDVGKVYGSRNSSDLGEHLRKALAYTALPVWAEWSVQIFEARIEPTSGFATKREVSYRFRVNGTNPETGKSAFASRLDRLEERILEAPGPDANAQRSIAELVFLRLVVPSNPTEDVAALARDIGVRLKADPVGTLRQLLDDLRALDKVMASIASAHIKVLQTKSKRLVDTANRVARRVYVTVHKNIVDWNALLSMSSTRTEVLVKNDRGNDNILWFEHLMIADDPAVVPGTLASYWVETRLVERSLTPVEGRTELRMQRDNSQPVLPIRFVPFQSKKGEAGALWEADDHSHQTFDLGCGVDVEYEVRPLSLTRNVGDAEKAKSEQWRTASCSAFSLVVYLALWEIVRRIRALDGMDTLAAYLLRLQPRGREAHSTDGNAAIYAIAHAIERALTRELPVKMQGYLTQKTEQERWRRRGTLAALQGGFPLQTDTRGEAGLDRVALVSYVTRPCDTHPQHPDADGFLYVSRTYCADKHDSGVRLVVDSMRSRLVEARKDFHEPEMVLEEIARLRTAGYRHIILLSHHFGNRHIGRAADRHAPHGSFEFLEEISTRFPDVFVYPLRRDVFPATRLHTRIATESAFEVLSFKDHERMFTADERDMLRGLMPVYTFATLDVVSDTGRPQSGFCTYFLDAEERLSEWSQIARQNILGTGANKAVRESLIAVLRGLHYIESEKIASKTQALPVLDPFGWATPTTSGAAGELPVMERRRAGSVLLSFPAVLAHVTKVLHKEGGA